MKIVDKKKFITFLITLFSIILFLVFTIKFIQSLNETREIDHIEEYIITSGETLWEIASRYKPNDMNIQEYLFNLQEYNNITPIIYPNQKIDILIYE